MRTETNMKYENCTGCGACYNSCANNAIEWKNEYDGFNYPVVKKELCINCNMCSRVCPVYEKPVEGSSKENDILFWAYKNPNKIKKFNSSSGGLFIELAEKIIEQNGIIYGAAFEDNLLVCHIRVDKCEDISRIQGSKYVQSEIGESYKKVKQDLLLNRIVLFSGTPCQIAGLYSFLNKDYDNLFCIEVACHGVSSPRLWSEYIKYRIGNNIEIKPSFRNKKHGWRRFGISLGNTYFKIHQDVSGKYTASLNKASNCYHYKNNSLRLIFKFRKFLT